jgi:hypothetical protein
VKNVGQRAIGGQRYTMRAGETEKLRSEGRETAT